MDLRSHLAGASATPPAAPSSPSVGFPAAGNPGIDPATVPGPYWFHQIAEELRAIQVAAGQTPSQGSLSQLLGALQTLFAASAYLGTRPSHTYTANDWAWLDKAQGLIVQWCSGVTTTAEGTQTITFPTNFPNACLFVLPSAMANGVGGAYDTWYQLISKTANDCVIQAQQPASNANPCTPLVLAIGF